MKLCVLDNEKLGSRLHEVKRWHGTARLPDGESESDYEHSLDMLRIKDEMFEKFENLKNEFSDRALSIMIEVHDTGEVFDGDPPQEFTPEQRAEHDVNERRHGLWLYHNNQEVRELYRRSFDVEDGDKEALMSKFLDKYQAGTTVMTRIAGEQEPVAVVENIEEYTLKHAYKVYKRLAPLLSEEAHNELREILKDYQSRATEIRNILKAEINNIIN